MTAPNNVLGGRFRANVLHTDCQLELWLNNKGCLEGWFTADNERLEITGGVPSTLNEVYGLIREPGGDTLAVFRASPDHDDLRLELDVPMHGDTMKLASAETIVFQRQT